MRRRAILTVLTVWLMSLSSAWAESEFKANRLIKVLDQEVECHAPYKTKATYELMLNGPTIEHTKRQIQ